MFRIRAAILERTLSIKYMFFNNTVDNKKPSTIAASEELLFISEQNEVNLCGEESTWIVDLGASFHLAPQPRVFLIIYNR